jgi:hypothetical protein
MKRKSRPGEVICWCGVYRRKDGRPFPHRQLGGACNGGAFVYAYFQEQMHRACLDCHLREVIEDSETYEVVCQAGEGREPSTMCPGLQEHIDFNGIKLYGVNRV